MGLEVLIAPPVEPLAVVLARLAADGFPTTVMMVDGALVTPGAVPPAGWRDVRLRTPAGTVTLASRPGGVAVLVFGNADAALQQAQRRVAEALRLPD